MTDTWEYNKFRIGYALSEIFVVFTLNEFIMFAVDDRDWQPDLSQVSHRIIGLRSLHQTDRVNKLIELMVQHLFVGDN